MLSTRNRRPHGARIAADSHLSAITYPPPISSPAASWTFLAANLDALEIGLHVSWQDGVWPLLSSQLEALNRTSPYKPCPGLAPYNIDGNLYPRSCRKGFQFALELPAGKLHIKRTTASSLTSPNVLLCCPSRALWSIGFPSCLQKAHQALTALGGRVDQAKPSRVDLAADFHIAGGLSREFLETHAVSLSRQRSSEGTVNRFETFYAGRGESILLRVYDKGRELAKNPDNLDRFVHAWGRTSAKDVWRVEFQLRRESLRACGIDTVADLTPRLPELWTYLTTEWFSLRNPDNRNTTRRTLHPWWTAVQNVASAWGVPGTLSRRTTSTTLDTTQLLNQIAGCLVGVAARRDLPTLDQAIEWLSSRLPGTTIGQEFSQRVREKRIGLGIADPAAEEQAPQEVRT